MKYDSEEIRFVADALLALYRERGDPDLTEDTLGRFARRDLGHQKALTTMFGDPEDPFWSAEFERAVARAQLRPRQMQVFELRLRGWTFEQIGRRVTASTSSVARSFVRAISRVRQARRHDPYSGLGEIYRRETRRRR